MRPAGACRSTCTADVCNCVIISATHTAELLRVALCMGTDMMTSFGFREQDSESKNAIDGFQCAHVLNQSTVLDLETNADAWPSEGKVHHSCVVIVWKLNGEH